MAASSMAAKARAEWVWFDGDCVSAKPTAGLAAKKEWVNMDNVFLKKSAASGTSARSNIRVNPVYFPINIGDSSYSQW
jgi:hypothetical protein